MQKGTISVQTENIFPIIKKFLYSDHEIFIRELVSNAVDATTKLNTLANKGEFKGEIGDTTIQILLDEEQKTLTIRDRGVGMTEEEVMKYLNQVAFSSAAEFLEKYQEDGNIIGHFGLGFYSAFMVADKVEVITRSWQDAPAVKWSCEGNPEYSLEPAEREARGTDVVLHINAENKEFLEKDRIEGLLKKYCKFLPVPIQFGTRTETYTEGEGEEESEQKTREVPNIINHTEPIWKKPPTELTDEDYRRFYQELYPFSPAPMFWIHLNIDYPFNLTGILFFPKLGNTLEVQKNKIQLYSNQVYVTDEVKEIVPEFLTLLHGVIDSPDIPLNVSRSYLQSDASVKKITGYITRKVADKLKELFDKDRENYEQKWSDLGIFVKYGMISEEKFYDKAVDFALLQNVDDAYFTLDEYRQKVKDLQTDKHDKLVFLYTNQLAAHDSFIQSAKARNYDVLLFDQVLDNHFIQQLEHKLGDVTFVRVDSDTVDNLVQKDESAEAVLSEKEQEKVKNLFGEMAGEGHQVQVKPLSPEDQPVVITRPEFLRRMKEMQALQGMDASMFPESFQVVINANHPLIAEKLVRMKKEEKRQSLARHLYDLARLNQGMLTGADLTAFVKRSLEWVQ